MNETAKKSRVTATKNWLKRNERKILITATVVSTTTAVLMRSGIHQHNQFLREHGLYEQFYNIEAFNEAA